MRTLRVKKGESCRVQRKINEMKMNKKVNRGWKTKCFVMMKFFVRSGYF